MKQISSNPDVTLWTKTYSSLLLLNFLLCFGFYMLPSTMPAYVKQIGGSNFEASLVIGIFSVTSLIARFVSGNVVEFIGEKTVIPFGIITIVIATVAFIWLPAEGILLLRSVQGIGWGIATAAIATAVFKVVPEQIRGEGAGYYSLTIIICSSLTPIGAILLMNNFEFYVVLTASAVLTAASLLLLKNSLNHFPDHMATSQRTKPRSANILAKGALLPSILCFILTIPLSGIMAYLVLLGKEKHMDNIWVFFIGYAIAILLTRPFVGRLFDRRGHGVIIIPGGILMILGLLALSFASAAAMLVIASLLYGAGYGAVQPSLQAWAVNRCPVDRKGAANGLFLSSIDLGYLVGAVTLGAIAGWKGYSFMYFCSALCMIVFMVIYVIHLGISRQYQ